MKPIFILNAPKRVGKDTVANQIVEECGVRTASFKYPIYDLFIKTTGMPSDEFFGLYLVDGWKDSPQAFLGGKRPRDLMIHISENYVKPFFGKDYYGKWIADYIDFAEKDSGSEMAWIIPDGGFQEEFDAVKKVFGDRVKLIHMYREGHKDFTGDSRNWIYEPTVTFNTTEGNEEVLNYIKKELLKIN